MRHSSRVLIWKTENPYSRKKAVEIADNMFFF